MDAEGAVAAGGVASVGVASGGVASVGVASGGVSSDSVASGGVASAGDAGAGVRAEAAADDVALLAEALRFPFPDVGGRAGSVARWVSTSGESSGVGGASSARA